MKQGQDMYNGNFRENPGVATVDTPSAAFRRQHRELEPCRDLMGGTEAMRRAGAKYIPQERGESPQEHEERVRKATLRNVFSQTISYYRGQVFCRPVVLDAADKGLTDEQLAQFRAWAEDVDQRGKALGIWAGDTFQQGLVDGVTFALVDFTSITTRIQADGVTEYLDAAGEWRPKTESTARDEGWRPYLVHVKAEQVLDCRAEWRQGRRVITHFRYMELAFEPDPDNEWDEIAVQKIRVYRPGSWEVWRKAETDIDFRLEASGSMSLPEVPVAVFRPGEPRGEFTARPALMDLAWENIKHWAADSDHEVMMRNMRRSMIVISGAEPETNAQGEKEPLVLSANRVLYLPVGAGVEGVGPDAVAVESSRNDKKDIEEAMAAYGRQNLQTPRYDLTAAQVKRESSENNSALKNWALCCQDFLEVCLRFVGWWWGFSDGPSVKVNDEFAEGVDREFLISLRGTLLSNETLSNILRRTGDLPDDYEYADEAARIAQDVGVNAGPSFGASLVQRLRGGAVLGQAAGEQGAEELDAKQDKMFGRQGQGRRE